jgi:hypothetical protein
MPMPMPSFRYCAPFSSSCSCFCLPLWLLPRTSSLTAVSIRVCPPGLGPSLSRGGTGFRHSHPARGDRYPLGRRPVRTEEIVAYGLALAEASPFVTYLEFGRTHEDRPLFLLAISDPQTLARLDDFQAEHRALLNSGADPQGRGRPQGRGLAGLQYSRG